MGIHEDSDAPLLQKNALIPQRVSGTPQPEVPAVARMPKRRA